jgi:PIN domain nuclease of toxin-antitoxin system
MRILPDTHGFLWWGTDHVHSLPDYHRDSFDRMLIAQSQLENMPILTGDPLIAQYPVETIW